MQGDENQNVPEPAVLNADSTAVRKPSWQAGAEAGGLPQKLISALSTTLTPASARAAFHFSIIAAASLL